MASNKEIIDDFKTMIKDLLDPDKIEEAKRKEAIKKMREQKIKDYAI